MESSPGWTQRQTRETRACCMLAGPGQLLSTEHRGMVFREQDDNEGSVVCCQGCALRVGGGGDSWHSEGMFFLMQKGNGRAHFRGRSAFVRAATGPTVAAVTRLSLAVSCSHPGGGFPSLSVQGPHTRLLPGLERGPLFVHASLHLTPEYTSGGSEIQT